MLTHGAVAAIATDHVDMARVRPIAAAWLASIMTMEM